MTWSWFYLVFICMAAWSSSPYKAFWSLFDRRGELRPCLSVCTSCKPSSFTCPYAQAIVHAINKIVIVLIFVICSDVLSLPASCLLSLLFCLHIGSPLLAIHQPNILLTYCTGKSGNIHTCTGSFSTTSVNFPESPWPIPSGQDLGVTRKRTKDIEHLHSVHSVARSLAHFPLVRDGWDFITNRVYESLKPANIYILLIYHWSYLI